MPARSPAETAENVASVLEHASSPESLGHAAEIVTGRDHRAAVASFVEALGKAGSRRTRPRCRWMGVHYGLRQRDPAVCAARLMNAASENGVAVQRRGVFSLVTRR